MIYNYNNYIELIKEGLISTHNIQKYYGSLEIQLKSIGVNVEINIISKFIYDLKILNTNKLSNEKLEHIININQNLLGYYPSYMWIENDFGKNSFPFDKKYLSNKSLSITIRFESKYDDNLYKNDIDIPEFAFHLSPEKNKNKIIKNGLYPKSYNRKTKHPDRIYFFYDINDYEFILKDLKFNDNIKYILYKVKLSDNNIIHTDPNYLKGFYTYDNISPLNIEIIKENL